MTQPGVPGGEDPHQYNISQLELQVLLEEKLGGMLKAAWAAVAVLVSLGFGAGVWATKLDARVEKIEIWKAERVAPIEDYYKFREDIAGELAGLKKSISALQETAERNEDRLIRLIEKVK